jgi:hypothetical protein
MLWVSFVEAEGAVAHDDDDDDDAGGTNAG